MNCASDKNVAVLPVIYVVPSDKSRYVKPSITYLSQLYVVPSIAMVVPVTPLYVLPPYSFFSIFLLLPKAKNVVVPVKEFPE